MRQAENGSVYSDRIKDIVKTMSMKNRLKRYFFNKNMIKLLKKSDVFMTNLGHRLWSEKKCKFIPSISEMDDKSIKQ